MNDQLPQPPDTSEEELRQRAEARVPERTQLLRHIGTYVIINAFLVFVWALTGHGYPWFL
jgi:2TM domain